jgi:hypothetical protein
MEGDSEGCGFVVGGEPRLVIAFLLVKPCSVDMAFGGDAGGGVFVARGGAGSASSGTESASMFSIANHARLCSTSYAVSKIILNTTSAHRHVDAAEPVPVD